MLLYEKQKTKDVEKSNIELVTYVFLATHYVSK